MGSVVSAIGRGLNSIIAAIAAVLEAIVGAIVAVIVAIFNVITDILCCRYGKRRRTTHATTRTGRKGGRGRQRRAHH